MCNDNPVFCIRYPFKLQIFIHSQKRHPETNLRDPNMQWDFWSLCPESLHQVTWLFGDRGIPKSYRHMNGYSSHAYSMINDDDRRVWIKFHFKTQQGIENLTNEEAAELIAHDRESHQRDMLNAIDDGNYPKWTCYIQVMTDEDAEEFQWNPFDLTKVWPHGDFPLIEVGEMELNENVQNYHHEVEQAAFNPSSFVPGIGPSPDKMLQARLLSYQDAHLHRIGANYRELSVNKPKCPVHNYMRDGQFGGISDQATGFPNYYPNSIDGAPQPDPSFAEPPWELGDVTVDRWDSRVGHDDYTQAGNLFRLMGDDQKVRLSVNIAETLGGCRDEIIERQMEHFEAADPDYSRLVNEALEAYDRGDLDDLHESVQPHA